MPMVFTSSGCLAFDNNFFVRLGILVICFVVSRRIKRSKVRNIFVLCLGLLIAGNAFLRNCILGNLHKSEQARNEVANITAKKTNNVYLMIYDGYANRIVRDALALDVGRPIEDFLSAHGYRVYDAYTVGFGTLESMSAAFTIAGVAGETPRSTMAGDNVFSDFLKRAGYRTSYLMCGYSMPNSGERMPGDYYYPKALSIKRPENVLFPCILRGYLSQSPQVFNKYTHDDWVVAKNAEIMGGVETSRFIYAHSNIPDHRSPHPKGRESDAIERVRYIKQLERANVEIEFDVNMLEKIEDDAIVIVASDHGGYLMSPESPGIVDVRNLLDVHGILLAIHWPKDYTPCLELNCLQNVLLEVMIYLSGDTGLKRYAVSGTTKGIRYPFNTTDGIVVNGVVQTGPFKGISLFEAAKRCFGNTQTTQDSQ